MDNSVTKYIIFVDCVTLWAQILHCTKYEVEMDTLQAPLTLDFALLIV